MFCSFCALWTDASDCALWTDASEGTQERAAPRPSIGKIETRP